jgi:hypothetical protein
MNKYFIYAIFKGKSLIYIGITMNIDARLSGHKNRFGSRVSVSIIDEYFGIKKEAHKVEKKWISIFIFLGFRLKNRHWGNGKKSGAIFGSIRINPEVHVMAKEYVSKLNKRKMKKIKFGDWCTDVIITKMERQKL